MEIKEIIYQSKAYSDEIELRNRILRIPLGLSIYDEDLSADRADFHYGVYENDVMIAVFILVPLTESVLKMRQVAVDEIWQKKGVGTLMVQFAEDFVIENRYSKIVLHARKIASGFYLKLGYKILGDEFLEVNIPHFSMSKDL